LHLQPDCRSGSHCALHGYTFDRALDVLQRSQASQDGWKDAAGGKKLDVAALFAGIYLGDSSSGDAVAAADAGAAAQPSGRLGGQGGSLSTLRSGGFGSVQLPASPTPSQSGSAPGLPPRGARPHHENALQRATGADSLKDPARAAAAASAAAAPAKPIALTARNLVLKEKVEKVSGKSGGSGKMSAGRGVSRPQSTAAPFADEEELRALEGAAPL
jgi:hypothetical protein